jgi:hypothetical protein
MTKNYLDELYELREILRWLLNKELLGELVSLAEEIDNSFVDSYHRIKENSSHGENCGYAAKAKDLFLEFQAKPIGEKIEYIYKSFIEKK